MHDNHHGIIEVHIRPFIVKEHGGEFGIPFEVYRFKGDANVQYLGDRIQVAGSSFNALDVIAVIRSRDVIPDEVRKDHVPPGKARELPPVPSGEKDPLSVMREGQEG